MIYGSETWPMKVEDKQRLKRTERMMKSSVELLHSLGIECVLDSEERQIRMVWSCATER